ncbi:hypothetical protein [Micromonospora okii]|nr:hypothetical protein [Micromonospora okii]
MAFTPSTLNVRLLPDGRPTAVSADWFWREVLPAWPRARRAVSMVR